VPIREIVMNVIREMEEAARNDGKVTGVPTGFRDLDNMLTGMHAGELLLVAARPASHSPSPEHITALTALTVPASLCLPLLPGYPSSAARSDCRSIRWICKKYAASKEAWYGSNLKEPE